MTETTALHLPSVPRAATGLLQGVVTAPRTTLRQLSGSWTEWSAALLILAGIILLNTLMALAMGREGLGTQLLSGAQSAILASLATATVIWLLVQLLCAVRIAWQRVHSGTILIMIPLILGPVPVLGHLMLLAFAGLIALVFLDVAEQPRNRSLLLTGLTWVALIALALVGARLFG
ncbi:hypothetical protein ACN2MM_11500 [Alkalilimnicola ehrlichii MLHE-1]|uniref:Yip1 domain-containing protein n=1 Tax=Alkalilimnicola ehrlichii (strain ATCC BAA-1101 / DSM 17681 / MLHE-1) TaxID=187272 RepID=Q0A6P6_ALKEH|nr:hypothetical protein [Alkalilimnicola ehrlichii]ABI57491.1 hypothetical protein Mlg_2149 [Alkalilimnicola ehrlichii MLHE-1]